MSNFLPNQIVENHLPNGSVIVCRVIDDLGNGDYRLADTRDCGTAAQLIAQDKTWMAPSARIRTHDSGCSTCHRTGLVAIG